MLKLSKALIIFLGLLWLLSGFNQTTQSQLVDPPILFPAASGGTTGGGNDIVFRSKSQVIGTGNGATPTEPAGAVANDIIFGLVVADASATIGIPAGWTSLTSGTSTTTHFDYNICYIRRTGSAPSYTFTTGGSVYREVHLVTYSGVVTTGNPYEASSSPGTKSNGSGVTVTCDSVTTVNANAMVLAFVIAYAGSDTGGFTAPNSGGYTIRTDNTAGNDAMIAEKKRVAAGTESPGTVGNITNVAEDRFVISVALQD